MCPATKGKHSFCYYFSLPCLRLKIMSLTGYWCHENLALEIKLQSLNGVWPYNNNCSKISALIYSVVIGHYFPLTHEILFINLLVLKVSVT